MVQNGIMTEALELFRLLSEEDQLTYLSHLRSLLAGQGPAAAGPQ